MAPIVTKTDWKKAQNLVRKGWQRLGFKCGEFLVYPSEKLLDSMPETCDTVEKKRLHMKVHACPHSPEV